MNWIPLTEEQQLDALIKESATKPVVIYKHSTTCPVNADAKERLEAAPTPENISFYYLDLLTYRPLSNKIADQFSVTHQSPQVLLIKDGNCVYNESHTRIEMDKIVTALDS